MNADQSLQSADGANGTNDENACLRLAFEDRDFLTIVETAEEALAAVCDFCGGRAPE